ncbi:Prokaryotic lipoprotein-attachment site [Hoeflea sp. IMCC20628]|uniref:LPS translocon maturation chaperone LptM n=1 Tax=Hoeflea sp. IMCC20628 TaxID=1620421 RepID=UPI00063AE2FE|nr:lipoprotein [Hoeflea sp. IMCC20628]AKI03239.1 Prokaryotic lipoprotein-attachment site [Hoeflea sp. IMCC20628]
MTTGPWIKTICAMSLLGIVLTGCGKKGPLERPGVTVVPANTADEASPAPVRERRFILDGLLE